ncbi:MAG TPA: hypothetical protein VHF69_13655, partial [Candidatus Synoicihabitans sp.]|nr:hypothetical protein [Candidatus Synoicihabitans sp.]
MPKFPAPASPAAVITEDLLGLFLEQLSWLVGGAQDAKRAFTGWLLASPPPPSGPATVLAQARRLSTKHLAQLEQLLGDLPVVTRGDNPAITEMIEQGHRQLAGTAPDAVRYNNLMVAVQRISVCFGTACASAAET